MNSIPVRPGLGQAVDSEECAAVWKRCFPSDRLTRRQRFLNACQGFPVDRPPIWLMRQAGRVLPEYRALKEKASFLELVQTPELAAEVTLQPIRRFGFDAAILFSDILVVAEAMGQGYHFRDQGGVEMDFAIQSSDDIARLQPDAIGERLQYMADAISLIKTELVGETALLGFAGSPWTLANFMLEGGSAKDYTKAKALYYSDSAAFSRLLEKLTAAVTRSLQMQIDAGVDAVQIFDSLGGLLAAETFGPASARWITKIIAALPSQIPIIVFTRGTHANWDVLAKIGAQVLSIDWTVRLSEARARLPKYIGLQGNLDPFILSTRPEIVAAEARRILREMHGNDGFIFNLGHGVPPGSQLENIQSLVNTVQNFRCEK